MNDRLHICIVGPAEPTALREFLATDGPVPAGIGGVPVTELTSELLRLGHRVTLVTHSPSVKEVWRAAGPSFAVSIVPSRERARDRALDFFATERRGIVNELRTVRPDVVHAHWTYEFALGALAAGIAPVLVTAHDLPLTILRSFRDPYRLIRWLMAWKVRASVRNVTAVSPYAAAGWRREMFYHRPIAVIPNQLPALPTADVSRCVHPMVLSIGDASPRKNVKSLICAFGGVRDAIAGAELLLVGPGLGEDGELARWARVKGLDEQVIFAGPLGRNALANAYAASTVYCHPSLEETFGMVLLEALEAGLPVVAGKNSGAVPWTLFDGRAGRLTDVRDPVQISRALLDAIREPTSTVAPGFDLAAELLTSFSPEVVARKYLAEYERLVSDAREKGIG